MPLTRKDRTEIKATLQCLLEDCEMQLDAIDNCTEMWDVNDRDNWEAMAESCRKLAKKLNIRLR